MTCISNNLQSSAAEVLTASSLCCQASASPTLGAISERLSGIGLGAQSAEQVSLMLLYQLIDNRRQIARHSLA